MKKLKINALDSKLLKLVRRLVIKFMVIDLPEKNMSLKILFGYGSLLTMKIIIPDI